MLKLYRSATGDWQTIGAALPEEIIWVDLLDPTTDEIKFVERILDFTVPSQDALGEIEASSRLIAEHDRLFLSTPAVRLDANHEAELTNVGFIIGPRVLVTVRFGAMTAFDTVVKRIGTDNSLTNGMCVFTALLEAMIDRGADVLEQLGAKADALSRAVFKGNRAQGQQQRRQRVRSSRKLREALEDVGALADRLAKARDVLLGVGRIAGFADDIGTDWITTASKRRLEAVSKDVVSLSDYESRISDKIQLLLDAILGFINIQQNDLFKILTIASVVGIPPTIFAGIWGMNFKTMPELNWTYGYPLAWAVIIASGLLPLLWFKWRGWFD